MQRLKCWYKILCNFLCFSAGPGQIRPGDFVLASQFYLSLSHLLKMPLFRSYK